MPIIELPAVKMMLVNTKELITKTVVIQTLIKTDEFEILIEMVNG